MDDKKDKKEIPAKKKKGYKAPGFFRKTITEEKLEKKYVKFLPQDEDKKFLRECYVKDGDKLKIRSDFSRRDRKFLRWYKKDIRKNRKFSVKVLPLAITGVLVAGIVVFFAIFANPLLQRAMEMGLEAIFEAKSNVNNLRISLLEFSISIDGITVANRDKPMTNLFQMGRTRIKLKPEAVLRGKIYIEEVRADTIRFGTPRTVSGALPNRPPKEKKEKPKSDAPPLIDLQNFDAMALLNREYDKLRTPKLYDDAISAYNETLTKWQGQVDLAKARTEELKTSAQPILNFKIPNIDISNMDSVRQATAEINTMINNANTMVNTVQTAANDAKAMVGGIEDDINTARSLEQNAKSAIEGDIDHLKSYIDLSGGSAFAALEPSIREILSDTGEMYFDYGLRALEILEKLKANAEAKPKTEKPVKEPKIVFRGRDVIFPTRAYPTFYLGILASDFTIQPWNWAFDMRDISSDPDLTNRPVTLKLGVHEETGPGRKVDFDGSADFRTKTDNRFSTLVSGSGFPVNLEKAMEKAGINGFSGEAAFSVNFTGHTDGGVSGGGDVRVNDAKLLDPVGTIAVALDTAVREAGNIDLGIQYTHRLNAADDFKITTNIAELLAKALKSTAEAYAKKAMDEIEKALRERINQYIDGKFIAKDDLDALFRLARGDMSAVDDLKGSLNNKKAELEQQVKKYTDQAKEAADQAVQQVKDEAVKQGQQAIEDLKQGQTPSLQAPSVPSVPSVPSLPSGGLKIPGR